MTALRSLCQLALALVFLACSTVAQAQVTQQDRDYYQEWLKVATRAEDVVDANRASIAAMENLRFEVAGYREKFASSRAENTDRIRTLQSQLNALGPEPETGEEPTDIANLRVNLKEQLAALKVPRVVAEEAYNRANGLIGEIDRIIRERQARLLLDRGPSPLNPVYWPVAMRDISNMLVGLWNETVAGWQSETNREGMRRNLPVILLLTAVGLVLLLQSGRWSEQLGEYLRQFGGRGTGVWRFVVSLAKILFPMVGTFALVQAVSLTGILGVRGELVLAAMPKWALTLLVFNWLSGQLYARRIENEVIPIPENRRAEMIFYVRMLAVMLVLRDMTGLYEQIENISDGSRAVAGFPVILTTALLLLRLHYVGFRVQKTTDEQVGVLQRAAGFSRIVRGIRQVAMVLALISPVLAAFGYIYAAEAIVFPVILTLAIVSCVLILQRFFGDLFGWFSGTSELAARESLFSVLVGFVLTLGSLPMLALVWGARVADLTELWSRFLEGFQIGDSRISPVNFLSFALVFVVGYSATRLLQGGLRNSLLPKTSIDPGGQNAIVAFTGYLGIFLAALLAVSSAGLDLSSVAIVAGALSVGIGFGLQTIVSNFVSGIILLIERPISKGDWIEVAGQMGYVRDISVRSTRIETFDRTDVIVPNSDLISGMVTNYTRGNTVGRVIVPVGVAYGTDTRMVEKLLLEIATAHPMVLANPAPSVVFQRFGADSLDFEIRAILRDVNWSLSVLTDMNHEIARRFVEESIEIPFAQRDIWLRNPEALLPGGGNKTAPTSDDSADGTNGAQTT
ncbi:MAG: potassium efflux system protein [Paracoccaceae bacterium]|jgi:potassium efflux system protein